MNLLFLHGNGFNGQEKNPLEGRAMLVEHSRLGCRGPKQISQTRTE